MAAELISTRRERLHREATERFRRTWPELAGFVTVDRIDSVPSIMDRNGNIIPIIEEV